MINWQPMTTASQDTEMVLFYATYVGGSRTDFMLGRWSSYDNAWVDELGDLIVPTHWARLTEP